MQVMTQPKYLKVGDVVAIIATARKITKEEIIPVVDYLESFGLKVVLGKNLFNEYNQFSGTDEQRADDLQWALDSQSIKAVFVARGGYGTYRIIDKVNFNEFIKFPKWIIGYSDITVLHHVIHQLGIESIHATMPINFFKHKEATLSLMNALFGKHQGIKAFNHPLNKPGQANGIMVGGNLSLIYALSGTNFDIDTKGKILFLEDLDEYLYHIDRMMMQLKHSGKLKHLKALMIGGMTDMKDNAIPFGKSAEEIIIDVVSEYDYPVCFNVPAGHIDENLAMFFGREIELNVSAIKTEISF
jgi:muramoyltetrapeptide carboxypeptidase